MAEHLSTGTTFGSFVSWRWDKGSMRFMSEHHEHEMSVQFHKVGGRWSKTLPDGTPNPNGPKSYWTSEVDRDRGRTKYQTSAEAKRAAVAEYIRRFGKDD